MFHIGVPMSRTFIPNLAMYWEIVPPPPFSCFPSSAICQVTSPSAMILRIFATNSGPQSLAPPFDVPPVYFDAATPLWIRASLPVESTSGKCGSAAAVTSAESIVEASRARRTMMSRAPFSWRSISSATVFSKNELCIPVEPIDPISSLSHMRIVAVCASFSPDASKRALSPANEQTLSSWP